MQMLIIVFVMYMILLLLSGRIKQFITVYHRCKTLRGMFEKSYRSWTTENWQTLEKDSYCC